MEYEECSWPFSTKSTFMLSKQLNLHERGLKVAIFMCDSNTPELYKCEICEFESDLRVHVSEHFRIFHEGREISSAFDDILASYQCKNCDFHTNSLLVLLKHRSDVCNNAFRNNSRRSEFVAVDDEWSEYRSEGIKWYECKNCLYRTKAISRMKRHVIAKHVAAENIEWFTCKHCSYKCKEKGGLKKHFTTVHADPKNTRRFECEQCSYKTKLKGNLKKHVIMRHGNPEDLPWLECTQCSFKSKIKSSVNRHVIQKHERNPDDIRWFECEQCSFKCKQKRSLNCHIILKHTDPEDSYWFDCAHCSYKNRIKGNLGKHIKAKHKNLLLV